MDEKRATALMQLAEAQSAEIEGLLGEVWILKAGLLALVSSHHDPAAFSAGLRRCVELLGSQHSNADISPRIRGPIDEGLSQMEEVLGRSTGVRPPRG